MARLRFAPLGALLLATLIATWAGASWAQPSGPLHIPTPFEEGGKPVTLELVYRPPAGPGPHPTLLFTHGSTNNGNDAREVRHTAVYEDLAGFFNERGWLVVFLQRRGRGQSGGSDAEGWDPTAGRYACGLDVARQGQARGLEDLDAALSFLLADPHVDARRLLVGGNSRGGVLALLHAARHPERYRGAISVVGGWAGRRCELMPRINGDAAVAAARFPHPTLWLHGQRDPLYGEEAPRGWFRQFTEAGGQGEFHQLTYGPLRNDHLVVRTRALWETPMSDFLARLAPPAR